MALATHAGLPGLAPDDRLLAAVLERRGVEPVAAIWDDPTVRWGDFDAVLIRSCWDYHLKPARFDEWLRRMERESVRLWNLPATARWSMGKHYLRELEAAGVRTVETAWIRKGTAVSGSALLRDRGWPEAVVKPALSASAHETNVISVADAARADRLVRALVNDGDVLVQPFLPEITRDGEWSLCFIDGAYSHAVLKRPRAGDFRVQAEHGGTVEAVEPPKAVIRQASAIMDRLEFPWLYARVDGVARGGRFILLGLELLEPSLFLDASPHAPSRLANALIRRSEAVGS